MPRGHREEVGTLSGVNTQALVPHALGIARTRALTVLALRTQDLHPDLPVPRSYIYLQLIFQNTPAELCHQLSPCMASHMLHLIFSRGGDLLYGLKIQKYLPLARL